MISVDVDPQTTITAPRPMPDEVLVMTVDANGCWASVLVSKRSFGDAGLLAGLEETTRCAYEEGTPVPEWALLPETLDAREAAMAKLIEDSPVKPGDRVRFRDPRQRPGVPRSDDVT